LHVAGFYKKKNFVTKKIVHDPYVFDGPLPPALRVPLLALWVLLAAHAGPAGGQWPARACCMLAPAWPRRPAGGPWVIWVIWVTVLNCMAVHALGHLGHQKTMTQMT
jgi:hypothetical protein